MMTRVLKYDLEPDKRRGCTSCRAVAVVFRDHIRLVVVGVLTALLLTAIFSEARTEGSAYSTPEPPFINAPTNLGVTTASGAEIKLSWTAPAGVVDHYEVERSESISGPFVFIGNAGGTTFNDTAVIDLRAYLYRVRAIEIGSACSPISSAPSNLVLGTAISLETIETQKTQIMAQHFNNLRIAVNAVRKVANQPPATWLRGNLTGLEINADDVQELRNRLGEALASLNISAGAYIDPILSTGANGTPIRADHIKQLQANSTRGKSSSQGPSASESDRALIGEFGPVINLPLVPVHLSVLPNGRMLFWGRDRFKIIGPNSTEVKDEVGKSKAYVWLNMKTNIAVFRPTGSNWYILDSSTGQTKIIQWGLDGDKPVPEDYDGDGTADIAIYRPSNGLWGIIKSSDGVVITEGFGIVGDIPVPGNYAGDGQVELAIFRPSNGLWAFKNLASGVASNIGWGIAGDIPAPGDYDGDSKTDIAIFRPSEGNWYIRNSSDGATQIKSWGQSGDVVVPGDYIGGRMTDLAVYRPSEGKWYIKNIVNDSTAILLVGQSTDIATPADYDGDGKTDAAIFRPSQGIWQIRNSSTGIIQTKSLGQNGDIPVPKKYDGILPVPNTTTNLFCSGHSFLPDGRLLVAGGHKNPDSDGFGEPHTNIFDYTNNKWSRGCDMNDGRWYPYNVTLNTGETLILSGGNSAGNGINLVPQVYTSGGVGNLRDLDPPPPHSGQISPLTAYPYLHLTPNGEVFQAESGFIDATLPEESRTVDQGSRLLRPYANQGSQWLDLGGGGTQFPHAMGTSVLFDSGRKVLLVGGFNGMTTPTREAEYIDLAQGQPSWVPVRSMNFNRAYHTATVLPDGKVLVTGGVRCQGGNNIDCTDRAAMNPELWDATSFDPNNPTNIGWRIMAPHNEVRAYHSIAALLPDGRVLVGGGGRPGAVGEDYPNACPAKIRSILADPDAKIFGHNNVEIYSPPYLFDSNGNPAVRPSITSPPPQSISYGQTFFIGTSGTGPAPKVSLVRIASVTHGFNQDQRHIFLDNSAVQVVSGGINITAPVDPNKIPPGHYMLFVLNNGVPSVAEIIRVQQPSASLTATLSCDNAYDVYFNGAYQGSGSTWWQSQSYNFTLLPGKNVLAIKGMDAGGVAGLLADLKINGQMTGCSSSCWKVETNAPFNWTDINFDDGAWSNATLYGAYGVSPWNNSVAGMPTNTPGRWIWSSNNDLHDVVYFRLTFTR